MYACPGISSWRSVSESQLCLPAKLISASLPTKTTSLLASLPKEPGPRSTARTRMRRCGAARPQAVVGAPPFNDGLCDLKVQFGTLAHVRARAVAIPTSHKINNVQARLIIFIDATISKVCPHWYQLECYHRCTVVSMPSWVSVCIQIQLYLGRLFNCVCVLFSLRLPWQLQLRGWPVKQMPVVRELQVNLYNLNNCYP